MSAAPFIVRVGREIRRAQLRRRCTAKDLIFCHAACAATRFHHRHRARAGLRLRRGGTAAEIAATGRLPGRGHRRRPVYPGLRRRPEHRQSIGRGRRHSADVRRRAPFLAQGSALGARHRRPGGAGARPGRHAARHGRRLVARLAGWRRRHIRHRAVGGEHRGAAARAAGAAAARDRARTHHGRLADRAGHRHGAGAGAAARARRAVPRRADRAGSGGDRPPGRRLARQIRRVRRRHADRRQEVDSGDPALCRPYRQPRAVPPRRVVDRSRRGLCRGRAVRHLAGARRVLRRHDAERVGT